MTVTSLYIDFYFTSLIVLDGKNRNMILKILSNMEYIYKSLGVSVEFKVRFGDGGAALTKD